MSFFTSISTPTHNPSTRCADFLSANTTSEITALATPSEVLYTNDNKEYLSLLEIASTEGRILHVFTYLNAMNPTQNDVHNSFFRALEAQHTDVALLLLQHKKTSAFIAKTTLKFADACCEEVLHDYIPRIRRSNHYAFRFSIRENPKAEKSNIALIISAGLSDSTLFFELLNDPKLSAQLADSGMAAFLSATLNPDGSSKKEDINLEIAFKLLDIPAVNQYAAERDFDFGDLLNRFHEMREQTINTEKYLNSADSSSSLASLEEGMSSRTTPLGFYSRPPSVMSTLLRADSVMDDDQEGDKKASTPRL